MTRYAQIKQTTTAILTLAPGSRKTINGHRVYRAKDSWTASWDGTTLSAPTAGRPARSARNMARLLVTT